MWKVSVIFFALIGFSININASLLEQQRKDFVLAETMLEKGEMNEYFAIKPQLKNYPLDFYLDYQYLSKNIAKDKQVRSFIKSNKSSRYSHKLHRQWLAYLYKTEQWHKFVKNYKSSTSLTRQCQFQWARYQTAKKTSALRAVQALWMTGRPLPKSCDAILNKFSKSKFFTQKIIFQRFRNSVKRGESKLAAYLYKKITNKSMKRTADMWLKVAADASFIKQASVPKKQSELFIYATERLINNDVLDGMAFWDFKKNHYRLSKAQSHKLDRKIALQLAFNKSKLAYARLIQLNSAKDETLRAWTVRAALIEGNWQHVQVALNKLTKKERASSRWQYWQARVFRELGEPAKGDVLFSKLAKTRGFYGFVSADRMKLDYSLGNKPIKVSDKQQQNLLATRSFSIINEFKALDRVKLAQLYWNSNIARLSKAELLVSAKIAQQWGWNKIAILSVAQAKHWSDVKLRFPVEYEVSVEKNALANELPSSIIYGLIRRESMFDPLAQSPVGALGLMQIMPATGKKIVRDLRQKWKSKSILLHAESNLKFGSFYYKQMLDKFDGNDVLAAAAYNAGPHRVSRWLNFDGSLPADVWMETIPYKETRGYVAAVLTYAMIYQQQITGKKTRISSFLRDVPSTELRTKLVSSGDK